ncbi:MAG TPA: heme exporter protein CcmB [Vicinamibacterales bacterium]|nr:heme exporter protein CcmB [Vicinamibacterales bacterium]
MLGPFVRAAWLIVRKDVTIELRSRELLYTTLFFAVAAVLVFAFGFVREGEPAGDVAAGVLWIAVAFAGTLALGRTFERERYGETLRGLVLAPVERSAIYAGKLLGLLLLLGALELVLVPIVGLLFRAPFGREAAALALLLATGTFGFAAVGTLFAAMLVRARTRDVLLPVVLYPIAVPVIIGGVRGTAALVQPEPDLPAAWMWIGILAAFDAVFLTLALWTFEPVMTE